MTRAEPRRAGSITRVHADNAAPRETAQASVRPMTGRFLQAIWRRRVLLIVPLLLMTPLSVAAALLLPKTYVARSLLLLQEDERANPLAREAPAQVSIHQRAMSLEALLKSNQVLLPVVEQMSGVNASPREIGQDLQELRRRLSLGLAGSDFIEVELRGGKSEGLGPQLQQILGRFFEVLLADRGPNAAHILIQRRANELKAAEAERAELEAELKATLPGGAEAARTRLQQLEAGETRPAATEVTDLNARLEKGARLQQRLDENSRDLAKRQKDYEGYLARFADQSQGRGVAILNAPARVMVVDQPADPAMPASPSAIRYIAAGMLAAVLIGIGLAWAAETLDSTIRHPEQLAGLTGVPVLAHLPRAVHRSVEAENAERRMPRRLVPVSIRAASLLFVAALLIGFAFSYAPGHSIAERYADLRAWAISLF